MYKQAATTNIWKLKKSITKLNILQKSKFYIRLDRLVGALHFKTN